MSRAVNRTADRTAGRRAIGVGGIVNPDQWGTASAIAADDRWRTYILQCILQAPRLWVQGSELGLTVLSRSRVTRFHGRSDSVGTMAAVTSSFSETARLAVLLVPFSPFMYLQPPWTVG